MKKILCSNVLGMIDFNGGLVSSSDLYADFQFLSEPGHVSSPYVYVPLL